jgi:16S rRNA (cytosine967-C5)-methyltransferase
MTTNQPPHAAPPGLAARRAALRLLDAVLRRGEALEAALSRAASDVRDPADRALVHAIASATLRHLTDIDALIDGATRQRLADDAKARMVLRLALAQALVLGTPGHAAVATALPLVDGGPRRLVHGVLGALLRSGKALPQPPHLPEDVAARWSGNWGDAVAEAARPLLGARAPLDLTLRDHGRTAEFAERLGGQSFLPGHIRLPDLQDVTGLPGFEEGDWWVQDIAASLPARLLGAGEGRHVLDLCAAPGGKTMQLAAADWQVSAIDNSARRLERLSENLARTGLEARTIEGDVLRWEPDAPCDAILLDAPCSATGIFRRHPDVLYRAGPRHIREMAELQGKMLARIANWLKPGGRIVYATCSLEPEEGEAQIDHLLAGRAELHPLPVSPGLLPAGVAQAAPGRLRLLPGMLADAGGLDGFFVAQLESSATR